MSEEKRVALVIPSYWGRESGEPFNPADAVYDHPTPLDAPGTLGRALRSVEALRYGDFRVVVVGAATHPSLERRVERRLEEELAPFRDRYPVALFSHSQLRELKVMLRERGMAGPARMLSLYGYSNIRNLCLVAAHLLGAEVAVLFDDDQVYEDPDYLRKATRVIGGRMGDLFVGGLAGVYMNADGGHLLPPNRDWVFSQWPAVESMNLALGMVDREERYQVTPWVFGGNMVIHRELFTRVPFDPHVPRGEDIDYLINARFFGYPFLLDRELRIRHLPPPKTAPLWRRFREDLDRFLYEREKLRTQERAEGCRRVEVEELDPYPGRFLRPDLEEMIFRTCLLMGMEYLSRGDREGFTECMANVMRLDFRGRFPKSPFRWYLGWQRRWQGFMARLEEERRLRDFMSGLYREGG